MDLVGKQILHDAGTGFNTANSGNCYLALLVPRDHRSIYITLTEPIVDVWVVEVALAFGVAVQIPTNCNPLLCMITLNITATG